MRIVIVGAGPTGLAAAWRLTERGHDDWVLLEAAADAGGLAGSVRDAAGFTWDLGGHVLFSHYPAFDRLLDVLLPGAFIDHQRSAWVHMRGRFIPYPLQHNLWRLPPDDVLACLEGLIDRPSGPVAHFGEWLRQQFGEGLAERFGEPYNRKVWACPPDQMDAGWVGERVAPVSLREALRGVVRREDRAGWGPNARFRFPKEGGTGAIWRALAARLPTERLRFGARVVGLQVGAEGGSVELGSGERVGWDRLLSTAPLDGLCRMLPDLAEHADRFVHSSTHVVGVGLSGVPPEELLGRSWMYFPEDDVPFYRVTLFSAYAPANVPEPGRQWSLLCELSESAWRPAPADVPAAVVAGLARLGFIDPARVVDLWHRRLEYGYPTPFLGRDALLDVVEPALRARGIWSRGRFGGWKYEVSNQDHSFAQGVEAVDAMLDGAPERTWFRPHEVNA